MYVNNELKMKKTYYKSATKLWKSDDGNTCLTTYNNNPYFGYQICKLCDTDAFGIIILNELFKFPICPKCHGKIPLVIEGETNSKCLKCDKHCAKYLNWAFVEFGILVCTDCINDNSVFIMLKRMATKKKGVHKNCHNETCGNKIWTDGIYCGWECAIKNCYPNGATVSEIRKEMLKYGIVPCHNPDCREPKHTGYIVSSVIHLHCCGDCGRKCIICIESGRAAKNPKPIIKQSNNN